MAREIIKVKESPVNKEQFLRNKRFAVRLRKLVEAKGVRLILYGSLPFFGYTRNKKIPVNDVDYLVSGKDLRKIILILWDNKIEFTASSYWDTIIVEKGDAKVEFDSWDSGPKVGFDKLETFDFNGFKIKSISKEELAKRYLRAVRLKSDKLKEHMEKYNELIKDG